MPCRDAGFWQTQAQAQLKLEYCRRSLAVTAALSLCASSHHAGLREQAQFRSKPVADQSPAPQPAAAPKSANAPTEETVLSVRHFTDRLFAFRTTRPAAFRFRSGEFVMIGLPIDGKPLLRAYSIASPAWDDTLEFYSIKVPDGPLTSRLQSIAPGDTVLLGKKPTGTLVLDALTPAKRLIMFATGTGIAPFASLIRDPDAYERYESVILIHTCRLKAELTYGLELVESLKEDPLVGELVSEKLCHLASCTREEYALTGRITALMDQHGRFAEVTGAPLSPTTDRAMICGSLEMNQDLKQRLEAAGFTEGSVANPGQYVVEKAFVG
jgi:ferredoxin--NADP+ reductase